MLKERKLESSNNSIFNFRPTKGFNQKVLNYKVIMHPSFEINLKDLFIKISNRFRNPEEVRTRETRENSLSSPSLEASITKNCKIALNRARRSVMSYKEISLFTKERRQLYLRDRL